MAIMTTELDDIKSVIMDKIVSDYSFVGFGTGTASALPSDTTLVAEVLRAARQEYTETSSRVTISGYLNAAQANSNTIGEVGAFTLISGGDMKIRNTYATPVVKTSDKEVWTDLTVTVGVTQ